jgi:hypothetical protein
MNQSTLGKVAAGAAMAGLAVTSSATARPSDWPPTTDAQVEQRGSVVQATRTMSLDLPGSADQAFPLFGPDREREWSPEWNPAFVVPATPGQSPAGAIFLVDHDPNPMVWVMTDYDPAQRIVRYVVVRAGRTVTQLWIQVVPVSEKACRADVTYRYTALAPEGQHAVEHFVQTFPGWKQHWESHIAPVLAPGAAPAAPTVHR